jgi:hypothetical protein
MREVSTGSGSDLVKRWQSRIVGKYRMLISDQVATAPCTDRVQDDSGLFEAKLHAFNPDEKVNVAQA